MTEWKTENGYRVKTYQHGNATITVCRPILSDAEKAHRYDAIRRVLATIPSAAEKEREAV